MENLKDSPEGEDFRPIVRTMNRPALAGFAASWVDDSGGLLTMSVRIEPVTLV